MTRNMIIPKISNPKEFVEVIFTDFGDVHAAYDKNGNPYEAYTSKFEWDGKSVKNYVDRDLAHYQKNPMEYRYQQDLEFLRKHDLDLEKAVFND